MYQLTVNTNIERTNGMDSWVNVDLGDATVALTYQANDLAELKSREVNRSNRIRLPRTAGNDRVFGIPSEPLSQTLAPYRYFDCRLYDDGVELFGTGAKLQLMDTTATAYEVCIRGSLFDFFEKLKSLTLRQIDTSAYNRAFPHRPIRYVDWTVGTVANTHEDDAVVFPLVDWDTANNANLAFSQPNLPDNQAEEDGVDESFRLHIKSQYIFPAVKLSALINAICLAQGYTLHLPDELTNDPDQKYARAVVPVCSLHPGAEKLKEIRSEALIDTTNPVLQGTLHLIVRRGKFYFFSPLAHSPYITHLNDDENHPCLTYKPSHTGNYSFKLEAFPTATNPAAAALRVQYDVITANGRKVVTRSTPIPLNRQPAYIVEDIETGGYLQFWIQTDTPLRAQLLGFRFTCVDFKPIGAVFPTTGFPLLENLPDMSQLDLFKALCQLYGLVVNVNDRDRRIETYSFNQLVRSARQGDYLDWSAKLDDRDHRATYQWNSYGQRSYIAYAEDKGKDGEKLTNQAYFTLDNPTLPAEKTLFRLPFAACEETTVCGQTMAKIRMVEGGDTTPDSINEPKPKLLYVKRKSNVNALFKGIERDIPTNNVIIGVNRELSIDRFIDDYYNILAKCMLPRVRVFKEKFLLTPLDIQIFTHQKPIYLNKYACCFYVNKISNYQPKKLTEVELVAILNES